MVYKDWNMLFPILKLHQLVAVQVCLLRSYIYCFSVCKDIQTKQEMLSNGILPDILPTSIDNIKDDTLLRMNVVGCLKALQNEINIQMILQQKK